MTERFQTNALGFAPGKSPVNGIHPGSRRYLDAATRSQKFERTLIHFARCLTLLTSYDTAMAGSSVATSLRLVLLRAGCKHTLCIPKHPARAAVC